MLSKLFGSSRYLAIVKDEQLEISQPALDPDKSEVHHQITARERGSNVHRLSYDSCPKGGAMSKLFYVTLIHAVTNIILKPLISLHPMALSASVGLSFFFMILCYFCLSIPGYP